MILLHVCVTKWQKAKVAYTERGMCFTLAGAGEMFLELADKGERTRLADSGVSEVRKA